MPQIVAEGREYEWPDPTTITFREAKLIKDRLGVSIIETLQALSQGTVNEDVLLSMFMVAKVRADGDVDLDRVLDMSFTDLTFKEDEPDADDEGEAEVKKLPPERPAESGRGGSGSKSKSKAA